MKDHVRMKLNRNLHAQFKRVSGETNDERMSKLLDDSAAKHELIGLVHYHKENARLWRSLCDDYKKSTKNLVRALVVSIAVSVACVSYVCVVDGWLS